MTGQEESNGEDTKSSKKFKAPDLKDLHTVLVAAGGRPADALAWVRSGSASQIAQNWQALPRAMSRGDASALANWVPSEALDALQKICHDACAVKTGAQPRFFRLEDLQSAAIDRCGMQALAGWSKELMATARTVEHPYNPGLMLETLASRAKLALRST